MRRLIWILVLVAMGWSGYWIAASQGTRRGFDAALTGASAQGWQVATDDIRTRGFPNRLDTTITGVNVAAPDGAFALSTPLLQLLSLSYRPTHVIAVAPQQLDLRFAGQPVTIDSTDLRASLSLGATTLLPLQEFNTVAEALHVTLPDGQIIQAKQLRAAIAAADVSQYRLGFATDGLTLPWLRDDSIDITLDADLTLDKPLDRKVAVNPALPVSLDLTGAEVTLGNGIRVALNGRLEFPGGQPNGQLTLQIDNWRGLVSVLGDSGLISPEAVFGLSTQLALVAGQTPDVTLPLPVRNGAVFVGPLPLFRLPAAGLRG